MDKKLKRLRQKESSEFEMTKRYKFYGLCDQDFDNALAIAEKLKKSNFDNSIRDALLRDICISYGRPFVQCRGIRSLETKKIVPIRHKRLHAGLMYLRHHLFAHTDFEFKEPRITRFGMSFRAYYKDSTGTSYDYDSLNRSIANICQLISTVRTNLHQKMSLFYIKS